MCVLSCDVCRHEKVQENCIDLVGRIADRGAEFVSAREWMRICFELLELLKAHKKAIRRATVNTFGYIAKAIGCVLLSAARVCVSQSVVNERCRVQVSMSYKDVLNYLHK